MMAEDGAESRSFKTSCDTLRSFPSRYLIEYFIPSRRILWENNFGKHWIKKTNVESLRNLNMLICIVTLQNKGILYSF